MIVNPWPGTRYEDRPLSCPIGKRYYLFNIWYVTIWQTDATCLQWLYLTGAKFSDCYKRVLVFIEFISTVNILFVSGLRVRSPTEVITT